MDKMNITSAQYVKNYEDVVTQVKATIDGEVLHVPLDPANRHYAEILRQVAADTLTIADAD